MISLIFFFLVALFFSNFFSFLNSLLILESISLIIFISLVYNLFFYFSFKVLLLYFIFIVSESAIGLSILVKSIKFFGVNNFKTMNLLMF